MSFDFRGVYLNKYYTKNVRDSFETVIILVFVYKTIKIIFQLSSWEQTRKSNQSCSFQGHLTLLSNRRCS